MANSNVITTQGFYYYAFFIKNNIIVANINSTLKTTQNRSGLPICRFKYNNKVITQFYGTIFTGKQNNPQVMTNFWISGTDAWLLSPLTWNANTSLQFWGTAIVAIPA